MASESYLEREGRREGWQRQEDRREAWMRRKRRSGHLHRGVNGLSMDRPIEETVEERKRTVDGQRHSDLEHCAFASSVTIHGRLPYYLPARVDLPRSLRRSFPPGAPLFP